MAWIMTAGSASAQEFDTSTSEMKPIIEGFAADRGNLQRTYSVEGSDLRRQRLRKFYESYRERLADLKFETMNQDGKVDYILLRNHLDHELKRLELDAREEAETAPYVPFAKIITGLEDARRRMGPLLPT